MENNKKATQLSTKIAQPFAIAERVNAEQTIRKPSQSTLDAKNDGYSTDLDYEPFEEENDNESSTAGDGDDFILCGVEQK